jgi:SAM-dependent methyltransferase
LNHADLVELIRDGVVARGGRWADLGAGEGNFTFALAELLGPDTQITAVDKDKRAMGGIPGEMGKRFPGVALEVRVADFTGPIDLKDLDGILMANSLHFVRNKLPVLESVRHMLRRGGRLVIVEYGADKGNPWVPYPFTFERWVPMAEQAGFAGTRRLRTVPSRWLGSMYSAVSES